MPSSPSAGSRVRRLVALIGAIVLVPLAVVLAAAPAQAATATLTGGVTDSLGDQLIGVEVQAVDAATLADVAAAGAHDTTDDTAAYSLSLATGTYKIRYEKTGYTAEWYGGADALVITIDGDGLASVDGDPIEDGELGSVSLNSMATHTISGTAVSSVSVPLSGIHVDVYASDNHDDVIGTATTEADGTFSVTVAAGVYHVQLTDPAHQYLPRWFAASGDGSTPDDVTLGSDQALGPITLAPIPADAEFPIAGRVIDANGVKISGVQVAVAVSSGTGDSGTGATGSEGTYSVAVRPGTYRVTFSGTGFETRVYGIDGGSSLVTVAADGRLSTAPTEPLTDNRLGDFSLPSTAYPKTGTVHAAVGGAPVPGVTVRAFPTDSVALADLVDSTTTDGNGDYTLDLPIGTYRVEVVDLDDTAPDYQPSSVGGATPAVVKIAQGGILTLNDAAPAATLGDVQLSVASSDTKYDVTGDVVDVNGDPIPSATVAAVPQDDTAGANAVSTSTDAVGHYVLAVKAGTYRITYAADQFGPTTYSGAGIAPLDIVVSGTGAVTAGGADVPAGALLDAELTGIATYQLTGTVQDKTNDEIIPGIVVTAHPTGDPSATADTVITDPEGSYRLSGLRVGTYTLDFTDTDGTTGSGVQYVGAAYGGNPAAEVKIARGGVAIVGNATMAGNDLGITQLARATADTTYPVSGDLTDANGEPIVEATVTAVPQGAGTQVTGNTDSNGHYVLDLLAGIYRITYEASAFTTAQYPNDAEQPVVNVTVDSSGVVTAGTTPVTGGVLDDVALVGSATHNITGLVKDGGGNSITGLTVKIYSSSDNTVALDTVLTTGSGYTFGGRRIGTYLIEVVGTSQYVGAWYLNSQTSTGATEVKVGQGSTIYSGGSPTAPNGTLSPMSIAAVTADTTYVVSGNVSDVNGDGITGLAVTADTAGTANDVTVTSGDDGAFVLNVKAGTYEINVAGNADFGPGFFTSDDETRQPVIVASTGVTVNGEAVIDGNIGSITLAGLKSYPLTGTATNGSAGLPGITVEAVPSGLSTGPVTTTAAGGAFGFSLKIGAYTLRFTDNTSNATRYRQTYFGGEPPKQVQVGQGGIVTVDGVAIALTAVMTAVTADTTYDLKGTVYEPVNFDPLNGVTVTVIPVSGTPAANQRQGTTGPDTILGEAGVYRIPIKAGKYQLKFEKAGYQPAYLMNNDGDVPVPATVTIGATGSISAPGLELIDGIIDDVQMLFPPAAFRTNPKLTGKVGVGKTVTASYGALQGASIDTEYVTFEWFLDGKPADDFSTGALFQKFKVPTSAATKKLSFRVTIDDPDGMRTASIFTSKAVAVPKAPATVKGAFKKGKLSAVVKVVGVPKPTGTLIVKDGKKKIAAVKIKAKSKGKVVIKLKKPLKPGKHKLTLIYSGTKTIAPAKTTMKLKLKK